MSTSRTGSDSFFKYKGKYCNCEGHVWAGLEITGSDDNGNQGRLRYVCRQHKCGGLGWCDPVGHVEGRNNSAHVKSGNSRDTHSECVSRLGWDWYLKYTDKCCNCEGNYLAEIRITGSNVNGNRGRLRYVCSRGKCGWLGWCEPAGHVESSSSTAHVEENSSASHVEEWVRKDELKHLYQIIEDQNGKIKDVEAKNNNILLIVVAMSLVTVLALLALFK